MKNLMIQPTLLVLILAISAIVRADEPNLRLADGFAISLYADLDLANDIQAMTLDSHGRVVVTGPGYIKILHDDNVDGRADRSTLFATTGTGGMGLCFDGNDLLFMGDGWLSRYRDADGDGRADGTPERIAPFAYGEHGGHAIRKGPDGWWYVIGGNDAKIDGNFVTTASSPVKTLQCGAIVRFSPNFTEREVVAHGFRNPYDFDFDRNGDLFTYDSDCERDELLPWGSPTRIFQVAVGAHHGWRLPGYQRSHPVPDDMIDAVKALRPIGRGSPTGVVIYRHHAFPERYQNGLFALDWTFGKVFFLALGEGSTEAEVFLEPRGNGGFAPVDAVVAPDGALLIAIGGRKSRGAVYRIVSTKKQAIAAKSTSRDLVLDMPTPLEAHSRAVWEPLVEHMGKEPFERALIDAPAPQRVRAIEILTEKFGALSDQLMIESAEDPDPSVRARVAWSIGRGARWTNEKDATTLHRLAIDAESSVRLAALNALTERRLPGKRDVVRVNLLENGLHQEPKVRQATARLLTMLSANEWRAIVTEVDRQPLQARLTFALASTWRGEVTPLGPVIEGLTVPSQPGIRLQALRLAALAMGGEAFPESFPNSAWGYLPERDLAPGPDRDRLAVAVRAGFPRGEDRDDFETGRVLAMLRDRDAELPAKLASRWTSTSSPTRDFHDLIVLSLLEGKPNSEVTRLTVVALQNLDRKLAGRNLRLKQSWMGQLESLYLRLQTTNPALDLALANDSAFPQPSTISLVSYFRGEAKAIGLHKILALAKADPDFAWSPALIQIVAPGLPSEQRFATFHKLALSDPSLTDAMITDVQFPADVTYREIFLRGLASNNRNVVDRSVSVLLELPKDEQPERLLPILNALKKIESNSKRHEERANLLKLLARQSGHDFNTPKDPKTLMRATDWFASTYPDLVPKPPASVREIKAKLDRIDWLKGDATRGEVVAKGKNCLTCHAGTRALGPDLGGAASRLSREDLFVSILDPHRNVAPAYQTTVIATRDGEILEGMVLFESGDGVMIQTGASTMMRVAGDQIESRKAGDRSLMPEGLLDGLSETELGDLYAYLKSQEVKRP